MGRAYKASYAGPERFTAFGGTFCKIERSAAPELYALAQAFPKEFSRALRFAGNLLRAELKAALRGSGGLRASWPELSRMHRYRRMAGVIGWRPVYWKRVSVPRRPACTASRKRAAEDVTAPTSTRFAFIIL